MRAISWEVASEGLSAQEDIGNGRCEEFERGLL